MRWQQIDSSGTGVGRSCLMVILGGLLLMLAVLFLGLLLIKLLWAWTVPELFPRAVEEGYVARDIAWWTAFKLALFLAVLSATIGIRGKKGP